MPPVEIREEYHDADRIIDVLEAEDVPVVGVSIDFSASEAKVRVDLDEWRSTAVSGGGDEQGNDIDSQTNPDVVDFTGEGRLSTGLDTARRHKTDSDDAGDAAGDQEDDVVDDEDVDQPRHECPITGCSETYRSQDSLSDHFRRKHETDDGLIPALADINRVGVVLAQRIAEFVDHDPEKLAAIQASDLTVIDGVGPGKAARILSQTDWERAGYSNPDDEDDEGGVEYPRECHCGVVCDSRTDWAVHQTRDHDQQTAALNDMTAGEIQTIFSTHDSLTAIADELGMSIEKTARVVGAWTDSDDVVDGDASLAPSTSTMSGLDEDATASPDEVGQRQNATTGGAASSKPRRSDGAGRHVAAPVDDAKWPATDLVDALDGATSLTDVARDLRTIDRDRLRRLLEELDVLDALSQPGRLDADAATAAVYNTGGDEGA